MSATDYVYPYSCDSGADLFLSCESQETQEKPMSMPPDRVRHSIAYLMGEVHALFMFCQMSAQLYPDHTLLLAKLDHVHQLGLAGIAPEPVPEATIEGFEFVMEALRKAATAAAAGQ